MQPQPPLPRALRSAAAAAAAAIVNSSSSPSPDRFYNGSEGSSESGGLGEWPELLEAMVSALEGRGGGGNNGNDAAAAAVAALEALVAIAEDSPLSLSTPLPARAAVALAAQTPLDALVPRLVSLCRPGIVADDDARCGAAEALNLIVSVGIGASGSGQSSTPSLDLALPGTPPPSPLAPSVAACLPRLAAALFDLLSDATCARGRRAGAAGLVQLVVLAPGTLAVGPAASALVAAFVAASGDADAAVALEAAELWPALADVAPDSPPLRDALPALLPLLLKNMVYADDDEEVAEAEAAEAEASTLQWQQRRQSNGQASCSSGHGSRSLSAYAAHDPTRDSELAPFVSRSRRAMSGSNGGNENGGGGGGEENDENDENESGGSDSATTWNLRKASAAALDVLATTFGDELLPLVTPSIREGLAAVDEEEEEESAEQDAERRRRRAAKRRSEKFTRSSESPSLPSTLDVDGGSDDSDDDPASGLAWRRREASVLALGAIAEGCGPALAPHLPDLSALLLPCLAHPRPLLRSIACWALSRYCRWLALAAGASAADAAAASNSNGNASSSPSPSASSSLPVTEETAAASELLDAVLSGLASAAACDPNPRVQEAACSGLATLVEEMGGSVAVMGSSSGADPSSNKGNGAPFDESGSSNLWQRGCPACDADRARASELEAEASARGGFGNAEASALLPPLALLPQDRHLAGHRPPRLRVVSSALAAAARSYGRKPARMLYDAVATLADAAGPALGEEPCARAALVPALLERMRAMPDCDGSGGGGSGNGFGDRELLPLLECLTAAAAAMGPGFALCAGACLDRAVAVLSRGIEARSKNLREAAEAASRAFAAIGAAASGSPRNGETDDDRMFGDDGDDDLSAAAAAAASAAAAVLPPSSPPRNSSSSLALSTTTSSNDEASFVAAAVAAAAAMGPERDFVVGALDLISGVAEGMGKGISRFFSVQDPGTSSSSPSLSNGSAAAGTTTRLGAILLPALLRAADDPDADVRQSAFALAGDLARSCPALLAPAAADVVALATEGLSAARAGSPDAVSAANNAAWALGEVAVALPSAVAALADAAANAAAVGSPQSSGSFSTSTLYSFSAHLPPSRVLPTAAERLSALLCAPPGAAPRSLLENAAISLGRLALVAPVALAPGADAPFVARWCSALRAVRDDVEKEHAFLGLAALLRANPAAGAPPAFASLCEAVTSWRLPLRSRPLAEELASLMRAYRAGAGPHAWDAAVSGLNAGVREKLGAMCGV